MRKLTLLSLLPLALTANPFVQEHENYTHITRDTALVFGAFCLAAFGKGTYEMFQWPERIIRAHTAFLLENPDHYGALEIDSNATTEQITKAFRKLAMKHHPDKGGDAEKFRRISTAHETLTNPATRYDYDTRRRAWKTT